VYAISSGANARRRRGFGTGTASQSWDWEDLYQCREGHCLGETRNAVGPTTASDVTAACAEGHTGLLCRECIPGYVLQFDTCTICGANSTSQGEEASTTTEVRAHALHARSIRWRASRCTSCWSLLHSSSDQHAFGCRRGINVRMCGGGALSLGCCSASACRPWRPSASDH